ncbi:MAG TPA: hypothetical protein VGR78_13800 [Verrucomicrobiae bacterium]|nr:hypothetical protein [Verrucomicrobiae bacterium]
MNPSHHLPPSIQMDFPDMESLESCLDRLSHRSREVAISFVFIELSTGLSSCQLIRDSHTMTKSKKAWYLAHADKAFHVAEAAMWKIQMTHTEFDQMTAMTERLRFELQALH